jgi:cell division septation protein DedD
LSLSPDSAQAALPPAEPRTRMAATAPTQTAPAANDAAPAAEGRFLVQISSQKTEADAQASYRAAQRKYPDQLGARSPVIKRADLGGEKGTVYRAMVGPFASREEAVKFSVSYKGAGGQCLVP